MLVESPACYNLSRESISTFVPYHPRRQIATDETMIKFKGRLEIKQYIHNKPTKWGIKLFTLAESKTGYILNPLTAEVAICDTYSCYSDRQSNVPSFILLPENGGNRYENFDI